MRKFKISFPLRPPFLFLESSRLSLLGAREGFEEKGFFWTAVLFTEGERKSKIKT